MPTPKNVGPDRPKANVSCVAGAMPRFALRSAKACLARAYTTQGDGAINNQTSLNTLPSVDQMHRKPTPCKRVQKGSKQAYQEKKKPPKPAELTLCRAISCCHAAVGERAWMGRATSSAAVMRQSGSSWPSSKICPPLPRHIIATKKEKEKIQRTRETER